MTTVKLVLVCGATVLLCAVAAAQTVVQAWTSPESLDQWLRGRQSQEVGRDDTGIFLNVNPTNQPNSIHSPVLGLAAGSFTVVRITYLAELTTTSTATPIMLVGWLDDPRNEDRAALCAIPANLELGQWVTVDVNLATSPCWNPTARVQIIGLNAGGDRADLAGAFHIRGIELLR